MGTSYEYTRHAVATAPRTCGHCRAAMEVTLELVGSSGAIPDYADTLATRERAMQAGLAHDLRRALPLVRCPKCRQRSTLAVRLAIARVAGWFALVPILPLIAPGALDVLWLIPAGLAVGGLAQLTSERARLRRADAAVVRLLAAPPPPKPAAPPPARLPAARVVSPAASAPTAPTVEPLASAAPVRASEPMGDAPRLLRERDGEP